jgi:hypothetical protein
VRCYALGLGTQRLGSIWQVAVVQFEKILIFQSELLIGSKRYLKSQAYSVDADHNPGGQQVPVNPTTGEDTGRGMSDTVFGSPDAPRE